ncbi:MAG: cupin domain-containing protein [Aestuariibacter sp.]
MMKSARTYLNVFEDGADLEWQEVEGTNGLVSFTILTEDSYTGVFTCLTRFKAGANTAAHGTSVHDYWEKTIVLSGSLYDEGQKVWLNAEDYVCRPPGEIHGPFITIGECLVICVVLVGVKTSIKNNVEQSEGNKNDQCKTI